MQPPRSAAGPVSRSGTRTLADVAVEHPERDAAVAFRIEEPRSTPPLGVLLAYAAMLPLAIGALGVAFAGPALRPTVLAATILWGAAIVLFLSGVRRGLSFRTEGGATLAQVATSMTLFGLGLFALAGLDLDSPVPSLALLLVAFAGMGVLDPIAARRGEAPLYFARLRPGQMAVPVVSLLVLLALVSS